MQNCLCFQRFELKSLNSQVLTEKIITTHLLGLKPLHLYQPYDYNIQLHVLQQVVTYLMRQWLPPMTSLYSPWQYPFLSIEAAYLSLLSMDASGNLQYSQWKWTSGKCCKDISTSLFLRFRSCVMPATCSSSLMDVSKWGSFCSRFRSIFLCNIQYAGVRF